MAKRVLIPYRHEKKVRPYAEAARAGGAEPVVASVSNPLSLSGFAGLLLMGGTDVNPKLYGETPLPETDKDLDDERDAVEMKLIGAALDADLPILGICRGLQILNVYHGGTLIQHLADTARHDPEKDDHSGPAHEVSILGDTRLAQIAASKVWQVNSRHHQAVNRLGLHLRISARDLLDGTVEAVERADKRYMLAVQWHPEDQIGRHREQLKLFESFAQAL